MDINQKSSADHIIEHLIAIDVDGETMHYIIEKTGLSYQMLHQLIMLAGDNELNYVLSERNEIHDQGKNTHL
jgi:hypothetical protein